MSSYRLKQLVYRKHQNRVEISDIVNTYAFDEQLS